MHKHIFWLLLLCTFEHTAFSMKVDSVSSNSAPINVTNTVIVTTDNADEDLVFEDDDFSSQHSSFLDSSPLINIARNNDLAAAQELFKNPIEVDVLDAQNRTALMIACNHKQDTLPLVTLLLKHNANVKLHDQDSNTAAHYAALRNKVEVVKLLKAAGASFKTKNNLNCTPLHYAAQYDAAESVPELCESKDVLLEVNAKGQTPLHTALTYKFSNTVIALLNAGSPLDITLQRSIHQSDFAEGSTPFHIAARYMDDKGRELKYILIYFALFKGTSFEKKMILDLHSLKSRIEKLRTMLMTIDSLGFTPHTIELQCSKKSPEKMCSPLLYCQITETDGTKTQAKDRFKLEAMDFQPPYTFEHVLLMPDTNIYKAAFLGMRYANPPKKKIGWVAYARSFVGL